MKTVFFLYLVYITPGFGQGPEMRKEKLTKLEYPTYASCAGAGRKIATAPGHKAAAYRCVEGQSKKEDPKRKQKMSTQANTKKMLPSWTVLYNIVSEEANDFIGSGWEFFYKEKDAERCYKRHVTSGNSPTMRPYYHATDKTHLHCLALTCFSR